ncbi:MAG: HigA family addiction module antidote protein [Alphaproteobacteria bacterium]|nr:HigA family addiction module antidote protein [Alphaproteobacteria bacterium]
MSADDWRHLNRSPTHPGEYVQREILDAYDLTQQELADAIGLSRLSINEIVRGKRSITESTALRLSKLTGTTAEFWLGLQQAYNLWHVAHNEATSIAKIQPLQARLD